MQRNKLLRLFTLTLISVLVLTCLSGFTALAVQSEPSISSNLSASTVLDWLKEARKRRSERQNKQSSASSEAAKSAESTKPAETAKPAESPKSAKPAETAKPAESPKSTKPAETAKPTESPKPTRPAESAKPTESPKSTKPVEISNSTEAAKLTESAKPAEEMKALPTVEGIARLAGGQATVETRLKDCYVDVDNGENPYDVTWDYGELYDLYVKSVDWSLLFDADYYMETFPALAYLYHKDKDLLLQHFQTVGIHEGRQGCKGFNVAAYKANCSSSIQKTFGDHYECYYLYYAMNHAAEKKVTVTDSKAKKQLTVKLTYVQKNELDNLNKYRDEKGLGPLNYDPELGAIACYRAYIDALEDWDAHNWMKSHEEQVYGLMDLIQTNHLSENTVHSYRNHLWNDAAIASLYWYSAWYINYRYSSEHYEAIIKPSNHYVGSANAYLSAYAKENPEHPNAKAVSVQYDVFTDKLTTPTNN